MATLLLLILAPSPLLEASTGTDWKTELFQTFPLRNCTLWPPRFHAQSWDELVQADGPLGFMRAFCFVEHAVSSDNRCHSFGPSGDRPPPGTTFACELVDATGHLVILRNAMLHAGGNPLAKPKHEYFAPIISTTKFPEMHGAPCWIDGTSDVKDQSLGNIFKCSNGTLRLKGNTCDCLAGASDKQPGGPIGTYVNRRVHQVAGSSSSTIHVKAAVFDMMVPFAGQFQHTMVDLLSNLSLFLLLRSALASRGVRLLALINCCQSKTSFLTETLEIVGLNVSRDVVFRPRYEAGQVGPVMQFDQVFIPSRAARVYYFWTSRAAQTASFLHKAFTRRVVELTATAGGCVPIQSPHVLVGRRNQGEGRSRILTNYADLRDRLLLDGFEEIFLEDLTMVEKCCMLKRVEIMVMEWGSALANFPLWPRGLHLVIMHPPKHCMYFHGGGFPFTATALANFDSSLHTVEGAEEASGKCKPWQPQNWTVNVEQIICEVTLWRAATETEKNPPPSEAVLGAQSDATRFPTITRKEKFSYEFSRYQEFY